jgi:hypothetical protein
LKAIGILEREPGIWVDILLLSHHACPSEGIVTVATIRDHATGKVDTIYIDGKRVA